MPRNNRIWTLYNIDCRRKSNQQFAFLYTDYAAPCCGLLMTQIKWNFVQQRWHKQGHQRLKTIYLSCPPIATTISLQSFIGGGNGFGSRPRMKPKSTWKRRPSSVRRRLSRCLWTKETSVLTKALQIVIYKTGLEVEKSTYFPGELSRTFPRTEPNVAT